MTEPETVNILNTVNAKKIFTFTVLQHRDLKAAEASKVNTHLCGLNFEYGKTGAI